jgi:UDP-N-acetyl-D-mannosaminuronic acid dehydrogenase
MKNASEEPAGHPGSVGIIGGCGHVGLPLGLSFARAGFDVALYDINEQSVEALTRGVMPFMERGGEEILRAHLGKNLQVSSNPRILSGTDAVICIIGTPIDEHLNPRVQSVLSAIDSLSPYFRKEQLFVLRSTVFPGATRKVHAYLQRSIPGIDVAFCPERVVQGQAVEEIASLPQIVSGVGEQARARAAKLFGAICRTTVDLEPEEAELAKLFCNAWRYITFAIANQFYDVCAENDLDYYRIYEAIRREYPRMHGLPRAGFAAGPCLFKDTMQLAAFFPNDFPLGHAAMLVNEQLPRLLVRQLSKKMDLADKTVGILGMAFKADNDDTRESLAFKLRKLLMVECKQVLCTDPFVGLPWLVPLEQVLAEADVLVLGAPHSQYASLRPKQSIVDPWNHLGRGGLVVRGFGD